MSEGSHTFFARLARAAPNQRLTSALVAGPEDALAGRLLLWLRDELPGADAAKLARVLDVALWWLRYWQVQDG